MTPEALSASYGLSDATLRALRRYAELLVKWTRAINLIAPGDVPALWSRHIADAAQLFPLAPETARHWVDLGSGGGLPGLVIAILAREARPALTVSLVESDRRKAAFLSTAAATLGLTTAAVHPARIEAAQLAPADIVSARALAPLPQLCAYAERIAHPEATLLFPKGARADSELTAAARDWHSRVERIPSRTDPDGVILRIRDLSRRT